jgi:hypothetical protein
MKPSWVLLSSVLTLTQITATAMAKRAEAPQPDKHEAAPRGRAPVKKPTAAGANGAAKAAAPSPKNRPDSKASKSSAIGQRENTGAKALQPKSKKPCYAKPVQLVRLRGQQVEPRELSLTMCNGSPNKAALDAVSVLARPRDVEKPSEKALRAYAALPVRKGKVNKKDKRKYRDPLFVSDGVMRIHPGLLARLQKVAEHYPGKIIELISGYRPDARDSSRHHHGRALDLRVAGVTRESLRDHVRTFDATGCGYYPNSFFVHMDVRDEKGYWVDRSGPGEPADYGPWPPRKQDVDPLRDDILRAAFADLALLGKVRTADARTAMVARPVTNVREPENEADDMTPEQIARVRAEARQAIEQM